MLRKIEGKNYYEIRYLERHQIYKSYWNRIGCLSKRENIKQKKYRIFQPRKQRKISFSQKRLLTVMHQFYFSDSQYHIKGSVRLSDF